MSSYFKGVAIADFTFGLIAVVDGSAVTTGTVTGYISKDGGTQVELVNSAGGTGINHLGNGQWNVTITKEEMDADSVGLVFVHVLAVSSNFTIPTAKSPSPLVNVDSPGDPSTEIGKVRILINDNDGQVFIDAEIQFFLDENTGDIYFAAADALTSMASGAAQKNWLIKTGTKTKDFRQLATALLKQAKAFRSRGDDIPEVDFIMQNTNLFSGLDLDLHRIKRQS